MEDIKNQKIPSVSLFISGRPLIINKEINLSDSFVQLWLPGSAIEGVTDVIFTNKNNEVIINKKKDQSKILYLNSFIL